MPIIPLGGRRILTPVLGRSWQRAAEGDWWLSGGILPANCIAAYQPKGAASYAASLSNLANPGTYNATEGVAPDWDGTNGWKFNGVDDYLILNYLLSNMQAHSCFIRFSNGDESSAHYMVGTIGLKRYWITNYEYGKRYWQIANQVINSQNAVANGIMGHAGRDCYYNGSKDGTCAAYTYQTEYSFLIGAYNNKGTPAGFKNIYIQAFVMYDTIITGDQVSALNTAMAAL